MDMKKLLVFIIASVLLVSCDISTIEPEYNWSIAEKELFISLDSPASVDVVGENIPEGIQWSVVPEGLVEMNVYPSSVSLKYLADGEGELVAAFEDTEYRVAFTTQKYSNTGFHLKINGKDVYLPLIPNKPGKPIHEVERRFEYPLSVQDTITIEMVEYLPKEMESKISIRSMNWMFWSGEADFVKFPPVKEWYMKSWGHIGYGKDAGFNFEKFKNGGLVAKCWKFVDIPWDEQLFVEFLINTNVFEGEDWLVNDPEAESEYYIKFMLRR